MSLNASCINSGGPDREIHETLKHLTSQEVFTTVGYPGVVGAACGEHTHPLSLKL